MDRLVISAQTMKAFSELRVQRYEDRMVVHLRETFEDIFEDLGEPLVRRIVKRGIARAAGHGFVQEDNVCVFIDLMFAFGLDFDTRSPWAASVLGDPETSDPVERSARLHAAAMDRLDTAEGILRADVESAEAS